MYRAGPPRVWNFDLRKLECALLDLRHRAVALRTATFEVDRKSTRLNSSHSQISYAVFCLKKKKNIEDLVYNGIKDTLSLKIGTVMSTLLSARPLLQHSVIDHACNSGILNVHP